MRKRNRHAENATASSSNKEVKKKSKSTPIEFTTVETCLRCRPAFTPDDWIEEALVLEGLGERYQSGRAAVGHWMNAIQSYATALHLALLPLKPVNSRDIRFTATYNTARIHLLASIDLLPRSNAFTSNLEAIRLFREAITLAGDNVDRAESTFNLACSLIAIQEGTDAGNGRGTEQVQQYARAEWEAKELLVELAKEQLAEIKGSLALVESGAMESASNEMEMNETVEENAGIEGDDIQMMLEERTIMSTSKPATPDQLSETLTSLVPLLLSLIESSSAPCSESTSLLPELDWALSTLSVNSTKAFDPQLILLQLSAAPFVPPSSPFYLTSLSIDEHYRNTIDSLKIAKNPVLLETLSQYADWLFESATCLATQGTAEAWMKATKLYDEVYLLLSDPFGGKGGLKSYEIPPLLSSNRMTVSNVLLATHVGRLNAGEIHTGTWLSSWNAANDAVKQSGYGMYFTGEIGVSPIGLGQFNGRNEWKVEVAFISGMLQLVRTALHVPPSIESYTIPHGTA